MKMRVCIIVGIIVLLLIIVVPIGRLFEILHLASLTFRSRPLQIGLVPPICQCLSSGSVYRGRPWIKRSQIFIIWR